MHRSQHEPLETLSRTINAINDNAALIVIIARACPEPNEVEYEVLKNCEDWVARQMIATVHSRMMKTNNGRLSSD